MFNTLTSLSQAQSSIIPKTFLESIPSSSFMPPKRFGDSIPTSETEARSISGGRVSEGSSETNGSVVANYIPLIDSVYCNLAEMYVTKPVFVINTVNKSNVHLTPLTTLRQVNRALADGYASAMRMYAREGLGRLSRVENSGTVTTDEYKRIFMTPTSSWLSMGVVDRLLTEEDASEQNGIRFLFEEGVASMFSFLGFPKNNPSTSAVDIATTAIIVSGVTADVENIWGPDVKVGMKLFFIFSRLKTSKTEWKQFAFQPWCGFEDPPITDLEYLDITGNIRYGMAIQIGVVQNYATATLERADPGYIREVIGYYQPSRLPVTDQPGQASLVVNICRRPGTSLPFYF